MVTAMSDLEGAYFVLYVNWKAAWLIQEKNVLQKSECINWFTVCCLLSFLLTDLQLFDKLSFVFWLKPFGISLFQFIV